MPIMVTLKICYYHNVCYLLVFVCSLTTFGHSRTTVAGQRMDPETERPSFRILAPQYLCASGNGGETGETVPAPNTITVSMQTRGGEKLRYRVQIFFVLLNGLQSQKHTLSVWSSIRALERKINANHEIISMKNQINIDNKELTPGVHYTFNLVGTNAQRVDSYGQNFTVVFKNGELSQSQDGASSTADVSFLLISSELSYGDIPYLMVAKVIFCQPNNDFYLKWHITNLTESEQRWYNVPGRILKIPSGTFTGNETYTITSQLLRRSDSAELSTAKIRMHVIDKGFNINVFPVRTQIGIDKTVRLHMRYTDPDNTDAVATMRWSCINLANRLKCDNFVSSDALTQAVSFATKGSYEISASVTLRGYTQVQRATVDVMPNVIAFVDIAAGSYRPDAISGSHYELEATLSDVFAGCTANWTTVTEDSFDYFDWTKLPNGLGNVNVPDIGSAFLSEIADFGNETIMKDITLSVPAKGSVPNSDWQGLEPNARYKFRLVIACPRPIDESDTGPRETVTSFTDIVVETNQPPIVLPLDISPLQGIALRTFFKFSTGIAKDRTVDYPLRYLFRYRVDNLPWINVMEYFENMIVETQLPYSTNAIETNVRVCDSQNACSDLNGPKLFAIKNTNLTDAELHFQIDTVRTTMNRSEYADAFALAFTHAINYKNSGPSEQATQMSAAILHAISSELSKLMVYTSVSSALSVAKNEQNERSYFISNADITEFVSASKQILDYLQPSNVTIIENLMALLDNLMVGNGAVQSNRRKRGSTAQQNVSYISKELILTALSLSETLINSPNKTVSDQAKRKLIDKVHIYLRNLCAAKQHEPVFINSTIVTFEFRRKNFKQLIFTNFTIPSDKYKNPAYGQFTNIQVNRLDLEYCIGKMVYPSDFLEPSSSSVDEEKLFELIIYSKNNSVGTIIESPSFSSGFQFTVPIIGKGKRYECREWQNLTWTTGNCETVDSLRADYVRCNCRRSGFIRIFSVDQTESASTPMPVTADTYSTQTPLATLAVPVEDNRIALLNATATNLPAESPATHSTPTPTTTTTPTVTATTATATAAATLQSNTTVQPSTKSTTITLADTTFPATEVEVSTVSIGVTYAAETLATVTLNDSMKQDLQAESGEEYAGFTIGYLLVGLLFVFLLIAILLNVWFTRRRRKGLAFNQSLQMISTVSRRPPTTAARIKYARFHDEQTMSGGGGDNSGAGMDDTADNGFVKF